MPNDRYLIVGLGNPGAKYANTRHNVGFEVVFELADEFNVDFVQDRSEAYVGEGTYRSYQIILATPTTYMNRSGRSVAGLLERYDISRRKLLVIYDDLNLKLGAVRLRPSGSAGGHNGIQDVINRLGTDEIARLRIGIGGDYPPGQQVDYVLSPFTPEQRSVIDETVTTAAEACKTFVTDGLQPAMSRFNRRSG